MEDTFILTVDYHGTKKDLPAGLQVTGYSHRFRVTVAENLDVFFERDEEGHYRAILPPELQRDVRNIPDTALLKAIAMEIEKILE